MIFKVTVSYRAETPVIKFCLPNTLLKFVFERFKRIIAAKQKYNSNPRRSESLIRSLKDPQGSLRKRFPGDPVRCFRIMDV